MFELNNLLLINQTGTLIGLLIFGVLCVAVAIAYMHYKRSELLEKKGTQVAQAMVQPSNASSINQPLNVNNFITAVRSKLGEHAHFLDYSTSFNTEAFLKYLKNQFRIRSEAIGSVIAPTYHAVGGMGRNLFIELTARKGEKAYLYIEEYFLPTDELDATNEIKWDPTDHDLQIALDANNQWVVPPFSLASQKDAVSWYYPQCIRIRLSYPPVDLIKAEYIREAIKASEIIKVIPDEPTACMEVMTLARDGKPSFHFLSNLFTFEKDLPHPDLNYMPIIMEHGENTRVPVKMSEAMHTLKLMVEAGSNLSFSGDAGVGKTALAEMLTAEMSLAGYRCLKLDQTTLERLVTGNSEVFENIFDDGKDERIVFYIPQGENMMRNAGIKSQLKDFLDGALKREYKYSVIMEYNGPKSSFDPAFFRSKRFLNFHINPLSQEVGLAKLRSLEETGTKVNESLFVQLASEDSQESDDGLITLAQVYECIVPDHEALDAISKVVTATLESLKPKKVVKTDQAKTKSKKRK